MPKYADFLLQPTIGNASELISCALRQHLDLIGKRENYADYIANRSRVERVGEHGLFIDAGRSVVLVKAQGEVAEHEGAIWTHVVSLRREDTVRFGYDNAKQQMALPRSKRATLCKHMRIDGENLRRYTAFHNEGHHLHVHLMICSVEDNDGYLTEKSVEIMRSELAHSTFRQDPVHLYNKQNQARAGSKAGAADVTRKMMKELRSDMLVNPEIQGQVIKLSEQLQDIGGKKVYGYPEQDVKNLIDQVVSEPAKDSRADALYQARRKWQNEVLLTYQNTVPSLPLPSRQSQFRGIKNMVTAEAMNLGRHQVTFEDETAPFIESDNLPEPENGQEFSEETVPEWQEQEYIKSRSGRSRGQKWRNDGYKEARKNLYGSKEQELDFTEVFRLLVLEAQSDSGLAMHDLEGTLADGLGREIDPVGAQGWHVKASTTFLKEEEYTGEKQRPCLQYHIGKMFATGLGTEQDYGKVAQWFSRAVTASHKYIQYFLTGLHYRGQGEEQSYEQAHSLYRCSAEQGSPYADYGLAKTYWDGTGT